MLTFPVESWICESGVQQGLEINNTYEQRDGNYSIGKGTRQKTHRSSYGLRPESRGPSQLGQRFGQATFLTKPPFLLFGMNG